MSKPKNCVRKTRATERIERKTLPQKHLKIFFHKIYFSPYTCYNVDVVMRALILAHICLYKHILIFKIIKKGYGPF
jgi:hypothetical protein